MNYPKPYIALLATMFAILAISVAHEPPIDPPPRPRRTTPPLKPPCFIPIAYHGNNDGDTIAADVLMPIDITLRDQRIRLKDFDAWETTRIRQTVTVTDDEIRRGKAAGEDLRKLLSTADRIYIAGTPTRESSYNRIVAEVWVDQAGPNDELIDVAAWMRKRGHERK